MKEPVLTMSTHVGTSIFPDRLRCDAYADMKASALEYYLSPKKHMFMLYSPDVSYSRHVGDV